MNTEELYLVHFTPDGCHDYEVLIKALNKKDSISKAWNLRYPIHPEEPEGASARLVEQSEDIAFSIALAIAGTTLTAYRKMDREEKEDYESEAEYWVDDIPKILEELETHGYYFITDGDT